LITDKGKGLIAKYMLGQIPAYSSYIAIGCGARVISDTEKIPTAYSISGSTVTVTISGGHKFNAGDVVVVDMNDSRVDGTKTIATVTSTQLTFPANYTIPALTAVNDVFPGTNYAEYTAASAHRLIVGDLVTTTGFSDADFNNTDVAVYAIASSTTFIIGEAGTGTTSAGTLSTIKPVVQANSTISLDHSTKRKLNFEMARIPVTSRGLAVEDGIDMLVFGAEVPTQDRFGISEIGLFSAGTNNIVTGSDSAIMHTLANFENWELHDSVSATTVATYSGTVAPSTGTPLSLPTTTYATFINASDPAFNNANRTRLYEKPRMYDSTLVVQGDLSVITGMSSGASSMAYEDGARHVHLLGQTYDFSSNSSSDEIRLAFSVLYRNMSTISDPSYVGIIIEFSSERVLDPADAKFARMRIRKTSADLAKSHYFVETVSLNDLEKSANFSWDSVDTIKIYAMVDAATKTDYYISLDALRFENVYDEQQNASYGMVGYSTTRSTKTISSTTYTIPIEKETNRSGLIEFKLPIQIGEL
jgi:hypothetical protein